MNCSEQEVDEVYGKGFSSEKVEENLDEANIERQSSFDVELDKQDSNEAGPICALKIAAKNEPNDAMSCSEKDSDEVDSQRLPNLDSEAEPISWQDPDEEDIEKLCFDSELDEQDPNEAGPICVPKIAAKNEPNDAMSCSEKDSDEVDSQRLPNLDSEADAMGCSEKDSDEVDSERLPDLDSEAEVLGSASSQNYDQNILNEKNELHMSSQNIHHQNIHQNTQTLRAKYLMTNLKDEEERVYCGTCGQRLHRNNLGRHFKNS